MKKIIIYIVLFMFGIITFPVFLFLNWKNKNKNYKNYLIASGLGFAFMIIGAIFGEEPETTPEQEIVQETSQIEKEPTEKTSEESDAVVVEDEVDQEEPEESDEEPEKEDDDTTSEVEETEEVVFEYDDNGIAIIKDNVKPGFSIGGVAKNFSYDHIKTLRDNNEKFENGIIFLNYNETQDKYGNAELTNTIATYYSRYTLDKIQWDNWYQNNIHDELLYQTADAVFIHRIILDEVPEYEKFTGSDENTPDSYYTYLGSSIDEDELNFD